VLHRGPEVKAAVVLAGPFATERPYSYSPWVRWARFLAANGYASRHFDYRAIGESSGNFADTSYANWMEDVANQAERMQKEFPGVPLILHGLGLGGLFASNIFKQGVGNALILWSAPTSGEEALREGMMRRMAGDMGSGKKATFQDYLNEMNAGAPLAVQGYPISGRLWNEASQCKLYVPDGQADKRPIRQVKLGKDHAPLIAGIGQWRALNPSLRIGSVPLNPDLSPLFEETVAWIEQNVLSQPQPAQ
jgi:hypothetical protein